MLCEYPGKRPHAVWEHIALDPLRKWKLTYEHTLKIKGGRGLIATVHGSLGEKNSGKKQGEHSNQERPVPKTSKGFIVEERTRKVCRPVSQPAFKGMNTRNWAALGR